MLNESSTKQNEAYSPKRSFSVVSDFCDLMDCSTWGSSVHGVVSGKNIVSGLSFPPPADLRDPGIEPMSPVSPASPALQADSLLLRHQGSPYNLQDFCNLEHIHLHAVF